MDMAAAVSAYLTFTRRAGVRRPRPRMPSSGRRHGTDRAAATAASMSRTAVNLSRGRSPVLPRAILAASMACHLDFADEEHVSTRDG